MRTGRYFRLPDGPADLDRIWREASALEPDRLPDWLTAEDAADYRRVAKSDVAQLSPANRDVYFAERGELDDLGFIIDADPIRAGLEIVYLAAPRKSEVWSIGMYRGPSPFELQPVAGVANPVLTRDDVTEVPASFVADPFMIRSGATWLMFFEVMNWRTHMGAIALATSDDGLRWSYQQVVLAEPFHLSYPYVFEWRGEYYLIPESFQAGAVRLYRGRPFPTRWEFVGTLLEDSYLVDASVFRHGERWWMFAGGGAPNRHDTLRLFYADDLLGPWTEHPASPVVAGDPQIARPAGRVLTVDGGVVRFAQKCVPAYGTDVRAFEVTELTSGAYRERAVRDTPILGPSGAGWNAAGMHHLDPHDLGDGTWLACVDGWFVP